MEVYLSRNRQPSCLHLFPLSVDRFQEFFAQPTGPGGRSPQLAIERFVGPIECLEHSLKGMALRSLDDVSQLNALVEKAECLGERDLKILSGALQMENVSCLAEVYRTVQNISDYELIGGVTTERALGQWLVETGQIDVSFSEDVRPYLDYAGIGSAQSEALGGAFTPYGYVKRREEAPAQAKSPYSIILTLMSLERSDALTLPASEEELEEAKEDLGIDDFSQAIIANAKYTVPCLERLIPMDGITVETASILAPFLLEIEQADEARMKFCATLEAEQPDTFAEAVSIAMHQDNYEQVPEDMDEYGKQVLRRTGADDEVMDTIDGYMDFEQLGRDSMEEDSVRQTEYGLVRRLSSPFPAQETGQTMV